MNFDFTEEQTLLQAEVRSFLLREAPPATVRRTWQEASGPPIQRWRKLGALGLLGIALPEAYGGMGGDELDLVLVIEECGRACLSESVWETAAVAIPLLVEAGTDNIRDVWLSKIAAGEARVAVRLAGQPYVADADTADLLLLTSGGGLYAVTPDRARLVAQPSVDRGRRIFSVDADMNDGTLVSTNPEALSLAWERAAFSAAAEMLGLAERMLDMAVAHAKERKQFGRAIGSFQAVKHRLANALLAIELARPAVYAAAWALARRRSDLKASVSIAKLYANQAASRAARDALQVFGGMGFAADHDLHFWLKRAKILELAWGDSARHRERLARHLML